MVAFNILPLKSSITAGQHRQPAVINHTVPLPLIYSCSIVIIGLARNRFPEHFNFDLYMTVFRLTDDLIFPDPTQADPEGLLAVGGDLTAERLLLAYSMGIFPWYSHDQPILWWSPDPRLVLFPEKMHVSKSLKRVVNSGKFDCQFDTDFVGVICNCSDIDRKGQDGTWITDDMIEAYVQLHRMGFAHSVEAYLDNQLVGGLYGISIGNAFFGESMFSLCSDASKVALHKLTQRLQQWNFDFIDCQVTTNHLTRMGAEEISREDFLALLNNTLQKATYRGPWTSIDAFKSF